ncbi:lipopolysaccharide kinase InaA family protein [Natronoflexus pectinivorans]|uniref:Lipopolysaccharide kinase (Kdo/WaaP) family protein n=1 Tax=Natronoflexus pectinivorans TaxID=682526 RepID=A0A4R2GIG1_9BACT|nr:lipopolysaccharide kinase InaA family protein [Natronoflexus pectinivorans]TCO07074.1 lipopolysaccharide kinase (Kdo/WaaP) family protein [Natronoflexus pectinivorans]
MLKYEIHPDYPEIEEIIPILQETFSNSGTTIYKIRNEVKIIDFNGKKLCIKSFGKPNIINYFVYSFIRASKAKRSYKNALTFLKHGISTPQPLGYAEYYNKKGFLVNSYYISIYEAHDFSMEGVFQKQPADKISIIRQFAEFVYKKIHKQGFLHLDFGGNNILVKNNNGIYEFSIIDLNRLKSNKIISVKEGLYNLKRLNGDPDDIALLSSNYAEVRGSDPTEAALLSSRFRDNYHRNRAFRRWLFKPVKKFFMVK